MRRHIALDFGERTERTEPKEGQSEHYDPIYLYTHWGAEGLEEVLAEALVTSSDRWDDETSLAMEIINHVNTKLSAKDTRLSPYLLDDEFPTIHVDLVNKTVNGVPYETFVQYPQMFAI